MLMSNALRLQLYEEAVASYERMLALRPTHFDALNNHGTALLKLGQHNEALESFDRALAIKGDDFDVLVNRGTALGGLGRYDEAVASYDKALAIKRDHSELLYNRGLALTRGGRHDEAIDSYQAALVRNPEHADAHCSLGFALHACGRYLEALASFDRALVLRADHANALQGRGAALARLKRYFEAITTYERALSLEPDVNYALGSLAFGKAHLCDWRNLASLEKRIVDGVKAGRLVIDPFCFLSMSESPADQLACASVYVRDKFPAHSSRDEKESSYRHERIRIAYLSADFHDHATSYLMAGLFEQHDSTKFETIGVTFGPNRTSKMRSRISNSFERFVDVQRNSNEEVAKLLREWEVDIAVDLKGFTRDSRTKHLPAAAGADSGQLSGLSEYDGRGFYRLHHRR
jgi:predicted O-linked N-acetylglucosamine transferase (SPINDLY family)